MTSESSQSEKVREEFNRWAEAGRCDGMEEEHLPIVLPILDRMNLTADENILDLGCGLGWLVRMLAERVPEGRVVGIDISDELVRRARKKYVDIENAMFVAGGAEEIPWDANFFTHVISVESAYYWPDPARGAREMHRVLREGGSAWILINYYRENPDTHQWSGNFSIPTQLLGITEWETLFRDAGFSAVSHLRISDPTPAPESYSGKWFRDAAQIRAFRETGALLLRGIK